MYGKITLTLLTFSISYLTFTIYTRSESRHAEASPGSERFQYRVVVDL